MRSEDVIDWPDEHCWCIGELEWHEHPLIKTKLGLECCFPDVGGIYAHLIIYDYQICLGEEGGTFYVVQKILNPR